MKYVMKNWREYLNEQVASSPPSHNSDPKDPHGDKDAPEAPWTPREMELTIEETYNLIDAAKEMRIILEKAKKYFKNYPDSGEVNAPFTFNISEDIISDRYADTRSSPDGPNQFWWCGTEVDRHVITIYAATHVKHVVKYDKMVYNFLDLIKYSDPSVAQTKKKAQVKLDYKTATIIREVVRNLRGLLACSTLVHEVRHCTDHERYSAAIRSLKTSKKAIRLRMKAMQRFPEWVQKSTDKQSRGQPWTKSRHKASHELIRKTLKSLPSAPLDVLTEEEIYDNLLEKYATGVEISYGEYAISLLDRAVLPLKGAIEREYFKIRKQSIPTKSHVFQEIKERIVKEFKKDLAYNRKRHAGHHKKSMGK